MDLRVSGLRKAYRGYALGLVQVLGFLVGFWQ